LDRVGLELKLKVAEGGHLDKSTNVWIALEPVGAFIQAVGPQLSTVGRANKMKTKVAPAKNIIYNVAHTAKMSNTPQTDRPPAHKNNNNSTCGFKRAV